MDYMERDAKVTKVVFRKTPYGVVFAMLPEEPSDYEGRYCVCFDYNGGHSSANYLGCIATSTPATPKEYEKIKTYMENSYGYNLKVYRRRTSRMYDTFLNNVRANYGLDGER
jgi:hypothetical protein